MLLSGRLLALSACCQLLGGLCSKPHDQKHRVHKRLNKRLVHGSSYVGRSNSDKQVEPFETSVAEADQRAKLQDPSRFVSNAAEQPGSSPPGGFFKSGPSTRRAGQLQTNSATISNSEQTGLSSRGSLRMKATPGERTGRLRLDKEMRSNSTKQTRTKSSALHEIGPSVKALLTYQESTRRAEKLKKHFKVVYGPCDRCSTVEAGDVTLDFELEPGIALIMTPALLAQRGGFITDATTGKGGDVDWPEVSSFFDLGIEGYGLPKRRPEIPKYRGFIQSPAGQVEITSHPLRPKDVLEGLVPDLKAYLDQLGSHKVSAQLPASDNIRYTGGWRQQYMHQNPRRYSPLHWTVGLELKRVPELLATTFPEFGEKLDNLCQVGAADGPGCAPEYQGVVGLAATVIRQSLGCKQVCSHPKRCQKPWLVRTHFGDMVDHLRQVVGDDGVQRLPDDILKVAGVEDGKNAVLFSHPREYWGLLEMAEYSGFVPSRLPLKHRFQDDVKLQMQPMPSNGKELLSLAQRMQDSQSMVMQRLATASCDVHQDEVSQRTNHVYVHDWLQGMLQGQDIMSDHDSPISEKGLSKVVWKSMGAWRMQENGRVYLECRRSLLCLPDGAGDGSLVLDEIERVASFMQDFEQAAEDEGDMTPG